ncbi:MAG: leucine-rich repeat domain-containing protein, partial [Chryseobacterium sp.]
MKKIYSLIFVLFIIGFKAQIVNISDSNLRTKLLSADITNTIAKDSNLNNIKIDTNGNNEIDTNEVLAVYHLNLSASPNQTGNLISNISGLSAFSNLRSLNLDFNNLTSVDATPFTNLQILHISFNQLTSLNVNNLLNLKTFSCRGPMNLTTLDISNLPSLEDFRCNNNQLTSLNLSNKPNLKLLYCSNNNFTSLDLSGLTNLEYLDIGNNPISSID